MPKWQYADLLALDAADAPTPGQDLVALSLRHEAGQVQIRLDWLDVGESLECDVRIHFFARNAIEPALSIFLTADGRVVASHALRGLRVYRDLFYDTWFLAFDLFDIKWLHAKYQIQIEVLDPHGGPVLDSIGPVASDAPPPAAVPILLVFWNTFSASTPAQALRQWDGAHTGPLGDRHGLRYLLMAAEATHTPIFLLDIKTPGSLSALDFAGGLATLQRLQQQGLAILPDTVPFGTRQPVWINEQSAADSRRTALNFGLSASATLYTPLANNLDVPGYDTLISLSTDEAQNCRSHASITLNTTSHGEMQPESGFIPQANMDGPSLPVRRLLANAFQTGTHQICGYTQLGGDFSTDTWGMPQAAFATLRYLAARPWLQFLNENALQSLAVTRDGCPPSAATAATDTAPAPIAGELLATLAAHPTNPLAQAAWRMYISLHTPATPKALALQGAYAGQIGHLLAAARWANDPQPIAHCAQDIDEDGANECQLASDNVFAIIEARGGYVSVAAAIIDGKIHQIVAPSWQFGTGLSDPMEWQPERGIAADPGALPGAFFDASNKWEVYTAQVDGETLVLSTEESRKTFRAGDAAFSVSYETNGRHTETLGLVLDGWQRDTPSWWQALQTPSAGENDPGDASWVWASTSAGIQVSIHATGKNAAEIRCITSIDSQAYLTNPEDPNFAYPPGHYLPFPLALCSIEDPTDIHLRIATPR